MKKISNYSIRITIGLIVTAVLILNLGQGMTKGIQIIEKNEGDLSLSSLIPHDSISITSDEDFGVFSGTGTVEDPYLIEGYNITTTSNNGIYITSTSKYFIVRNCYIDADDYGIYIDDVADGTATIINNTCNNNYNDGIKLYSSSSSTVANNTCNNNNGEGIYLEDSGSSTVANNTFTDCGSHIIEFTLEAYLSYTVENNWVNGKKLGFYTNLDSIIISEPVYGQLILVNCTNVTVRDQIINNAGTGLFLYSCSYSTINNNTCNYNNFGIYLRYSGGSTVANNTCSNNNDYGIMLRQSSSSIVANNTCNNNNDKGIWLDSSSGSTVANNTCSNNNDYGIMLRYSSSSIVANNMCNNNNDKGIEILFSGGSTVVNNTCTNNDYGIDLRYSSSSNIVNNTFTNCGLHIRDDTINDYLSYTVENNWVNGKKIGFYTNLDTMIIVEPIYGQLILVNCTNMTVRDQILNNATTGLSLYSSTSSVIINNTCTNNNYYGIELVSSGNSTVANNTCKNNDYGIALHSSCSSTVVKNTCKDNGVDDIYILSSGNSTVANNTCCNNGIGIYLYSSGNSTVVNNTCNYNYQAGIELVSSGNSTVANNTCNNNGSGIYLRYSGNSTVANNTCNNNNNRGIYLFGSDFCVITYNLLQSNIKYGVYLESDSGNNLIHHNNFVDNNLGGTSQAYDTGVSNIWYYSTTLEGNFWSDWNGSEYYSIDGSSNSFDPYPSEYPPTPPIIENVTHNPSDPTELDTIRINASVTDVSGVQSVTLHYRINGGTWTEISMTLISGDIYSVTIGSFAVSDTIEYYVSAIDNSANNNEAINDNSGFYYSFTVSVVIPEFQTLSLLLPVITFLFLVCGLVALQQRKK